MAPAQTAAADADPPQKSPRALQGEEVEVEGTYLESSPDRKKFFVRVCVKSQTPRNQSVTGRGRV